MLNDCLAYLCKTIMLTGMRRGEALGLRWKDIDFEQRQLSIVQTITSTNSGPMVSTPKNNQSIRTVPMPDKLVDLLRQWKAEQSQQINKAMQVGVAINDELVFGNEESRPRWPDSVRRGLKRLLNKAGLKRNITIHSLRHAFATMMLEMEVPIKVIQETLGHASITTTGNTYSHVTMGLKQQATSKLNSLFTEKQQ
jgi:integrase